MHSEHIWKQQTILEKEKCVVTCYSKTRKKTTSEVVLNHSTIALQENMAMLIQGLSFAQILITNNILFDKYLKLWKSTYLAIHISKEMLLQRCLWPHMRDAVVLVIISP